MSGLNLAIIWVNLGAAAAAAVVNFWVARRLPAGMRYMRGVIGGLAAFYAAGYVTLVTNMVSVVAWSNFFRGVSPFAWLLVWALPAIYERTMVRAIQTAQSDRHVP